MRMKRHLFALFLLFLLILFMMVVSHLGRLWSLRDHSNELIGTNSVNQQLFVQTNLLILYNRIPKTGSTSFMSVVYALTQQNKFSAIYVNVSYTNHRFTFLDQYRFADNITHWIERKPCVYHGHFPFLNFNFLSMRQPLYINIVREPLERVVSHYYFIRYGDTFLPNKKRKYLGDKTTFDECVEKQSNQCDINKLWLQIPYFCGSHPECWEVGSQYALERAKSNVMNYYLLVGVTEQIDLFVEVLEKVLPSIFVGAKQLFTVNGGVHIRKTKTKIPLKEKTIRYFQGTQVWKLENEFYMFVKKRFEYIYKSYQNGGEHLSYLKIKP